MPEKHRKFPLAPTIDNAYAARTEIAPPHWSNGPTSSVLNWVNGECRDRLFQLARRIAGHTSSSLISSRNRTINVEPWNYGKSIEKRCSTRLPVEKPWTVCTAVVVVKWPTRTALRDPCNRRMVKVAFSNVTHSLVYTDAREHTHAHTYTRRKNLRTAYTWDLSARRSDCYRSRISS